MIPQSAVRGAVACSIGALLLLHLFVGFASGQIPHHETPNQNAESDFGFHTYDLQPGEAVVRLAVFAEDGKTRLDRQSVLKVTNQANHTISWRTTNERSEAGFGLPFGKYEVEINAVGYLNERKEFLLVDTGQGIRVDVTMRRDPEAVDLSLVDTALPAKARKEAKHGLSALKSGNLKDARKRLDVAYQLAPSNSDLNYLLGYLFYQQKDYGQAQSYLGAASNLNPRNVQALTLLGRLDLIQEDYIGATAILERAVAADSDYWMAHNLLAGAYLHQKRYEDARQQADLAIAKGRTDAQTANLVLGQALINLGKKEDGIQALKAFVQHSRGNPVLPQVRELIAVAERSGSTLARDGQITINDGSTSPLLATPQLKVSVKPWRPAGIDDSKPPVATGVSCPFENVMEMSGGRVQELADNLSRIVANEHLLQERMDEMGSPATSETRDYDYVASLSKEKEGVVRVDEYRSERKVEEKLSNGMGDANGFAGLALVFHPTRQANFEMTCEGLGRWHEQAAWIVHFKEREDRPMTFQRLVVGGQSFPLLLKGRAWIAADKFQIVRIESELASPIPEIQFSSEQQIVEYGPVPFPKKNLELWLPKDVEIYIDYRKRHFHSKHSYDHYMLYSVDSEEKRKEPTAPSTQLSE